MGFGFVLLLGLYFLNDFVAANTCSFLGIFNGTHCLCEPGWAPPDCSKLLLKRIDDTGPESYHQGMYLKDFPTFGGNVLVSNLSDCGGNIKHFYFGQTLGNRAGMTCWPNTAAGSIWESTSGNAMGPYEFSSWLGFGQNDLGFAPTDIPWLDNTRVTVETKLGPGATELDSVKTVQALAAYSFLQFDKKRKKYELASFEEAHKKICRGYVGHEAAVNRFTSKISLQFLTVSFKEFPFGRDTCETKIAIRSFLEQKIFVEHLNGFSRSGFVHTGFNWQIIQPKMPFIPKSDSRPVNPSPLFNSDFGLLKYTGDRLWPEYTGITKNMYFRPMVIRWNNPKERFKTRESLGIAALRADKFIWEEGTQYFVNSRVGPGHYEDGWFFETALGLHIWTHDIGGCKRAVRNSCGGSLHLDRNLVNTMVFENNWIDVPRVFEQEIDNLGTKAIVRQRPVVYFESGLPHSLWTSIVWEGGYFDGKEWVSEQGPVLHFAQRVDVSL